MDNRLTVSEPSQCRTSHPGLLSLAIPPWADAVSTSKSWGSKQTPRDTFYGPDATALMYRGINITWLENRSFSGVYIITENFIETCMCDMCICLCNDYFTLYLHVFERQLMCMLIVDVYNFASVEVFNKALLTHLLARIRSLTVLAGVWLRSS